MWLCGVVVVSWAQGLRSPSSSPTLAFFHLIFHLPPTSPTSPPSCDWVPGICWGTNSRPFLMNSNGPGGTSGAHTTYCEERPVLLRVRSFACMAHSACLVHRHLGSARFAWPPSGSKRICICFAFVCVCVCVCNWLKMQHYSLYWGEGSERARRALAPQSFGLGKSQKYTYCCPPPRSNNFHNPCCVS